MEGPPSDELTQESDDHRVPALHLDATQASGLAMPRAQAALARCAAADWFVDRPQHPCATHCGRLSPPATKEEVSRFTRDLSQPCRQRRQRLCG